MVSLSKTITVFSDGSYKIENQETPQLYQIGDDYKVLGKVRDCAYGGCPGVMVLINEPDTIFNFDWQMYLIAINYEMRLNNVSGLMGITKALMNQTGVGGDGDKRRRNYILGEDLDATADPRLDKLRTFGLNTHAGYDDGVYVYVVTMNGNNPPPMKTNPTTGMPYQRPRSISEIVPEHYLYLPETHRHLFLDCNNVEWKQDTKALDYGPFANGIIRDWIGDGKIHTFFPLVSKKGVVKTPLRWWTKLPLGSAFPSPFRSA